MILLADKLKTISSATTSAAGATSVTLNTEQSAVIFTMVLSSVAGDTKFNIRVFAVGDSDERLLYDTPIYQTALVEPVEFSVQTGNKIRVDIFYTGVVTYELRAKAIASLPVPTTINTVDSDAEIAWRGTIESQLATTNDKLQRILNHLRIITEVEEDKGDDF